MNTLERLAAINDHVAWNRKPDLVIANGSPEAEALTSAALEIGLSRPRIERLVAALKVYADPTFYEELVPSRAKDDGGQHARNVLNELFPE